MKIKNILYVMSLASMMIHADNSNSYSNTKKHGRAFLFIGAGAHKSSSKQESKKTTINNFDVTWEPKTDKANKDAQFKNLHIHIAGQYMITKLFGIEIGSHFFNHKIDHTVEPTLLTGPNNLKITDSQAILTQLNAVDKPFDIQSKSYESINVGGIFRHNLKPNLFAYAGLGASFQRFKYNTHLSATSYSLYEYETKWRVGGYGKVGLHYITNHVFGVFTEIHGNFLPSQTISFTDKNEMKMKSYKSGGISVGFTINA